MTYKILVIEDDTFLARLLDLTLKRAGYEPIIAGNGLTGMKYVQADPPPDLVLLDLMLPVMDGYEVLNQIRSDPKTAALPVIVVTGKTQATDKELALQLGANDYITKPYRPVDIVARLADHFAQQQAASATTATDGKIILVVSPQHDDVYPLTAGLGAALARSGIDTALFSPDPYTVDHLLTLDLDPPIGLSKLPESTGEVELLALLRPHASGLQILSNLEGGGELGRLTVEELQHCVDALSADGRTTLVPLLLSPPDQLSRLAPRSSKILVLIRDQPTAWAATRATLGLLARLQIPESHIGFVLIDMVQDSSFSEIEPTVVGRLPDRYDSASISVQNLATNLIQQLSTPTP